MSQSFAVILLNNATRLDPLIDVVRVEPGELADFVERHVALGDQTTNVSLGPAESLRESDGVPVGGPVAMRLLVGCRPSTFRRTRWG